MPGPGLDLIGDEELAELTDVIRSGRLSRYGPDDGTFPAKVRHLEEAVAERAGVRHALAVNSGTSALYLALAGLGVGPGDEVIVPGFTYVASISSIVYARARPVLAEVDDTLNLDPVDVEARITPRTKAIVAVHMLGNPARLDELRAVADRHGLALIEDAAQAFGATYRGPGWAASGRPASSASTSTRPSPVVTAACSSPTTTTSTGAASPCTTRATARCAAASRSARGPCSGSTSA